MAAAGPPEPSPLERTMQRASAVLAALYDDGGDAHVVLTRRAWHLRTHKGEVSFPGGGRDPGEALIDTARREAWEEVGLDPGSVEVIGELDHLSTVTSGSFIVPFVAEIPGRPELVANPSEVEAVLHVPLSELLRARRLPLRALGDLRLAAVGALLRHRRRHDLGCHRGDAATTARDGHRYRGPGRDGPSLTESAVHRPVVTMTDDRSYTMTPDEFRRHGNEVVEWVARYMERVEELPVLSPLAPGDVLAGLPVSPPARPEPFDAVMRDLEQVVLPGVTHWQSPNFFGYFQANASGPSILGELISAGLGVQGMLWSTSPAATELETRVLDWLAELLDLPPRFRSDGAGGGVIQDGASGATMCALLAARERAGGRPPTRPAGGLRVDRRPLLGAQGGPRRRSR